MFQYYGDFPTDQQLAVLPTEIVADEDVVLSLQVTERFNNRRVVPDSRVDGDNSGRARQDLRNLIEPMSVVINLAVDPNKVPGWLRRVHRKPKSPCALLLASS